MKNKFNIPLMENNITKDDINKVIEFLSQDEIPILTQNKNVCEFEEMWSEWLGRKYSVFVNSGSSANFLTLLALKIKDPLRKKVIVSPLNWSSDIGAILTNGFEPIFVDINMTTLAIDEGELEIALEENKGEVAAVLLTHILGYNGLTERMLLLCRKYDVQLIEDVCESHGATFNGKKVGTFGLASNFSFYYAHHMTSIEGGIISTDDESLYQLLRSLRSHGMLRESTDDELKKVYKNEHPDLNQDFIFIYPSYNMRSTEINAVIAKNQLLRLDENIRLRKINLNTFLDNLDPKKYHTDFNRCGNSNYAFTLLLNNPREISFEDVETTLRNNGIEFRRGMSGGGNQLRQPYMLGKHSPKRFPNVDYVHFFGWYIGNYPTLEEEKIYYLVNILNEI